MEGRPSRLLHSYPSVRPPCGNLPGPGLVGSIAAKITAGRLPLPEQPPGKVWVGDGSGLMCDGCEQPITPSDLEYEADLSSGQSLRSHSKCFAAWHQARVEQPPACVK